ncbi:MAG: hypothetical protein DRI24_18435 [Deltaproteobacteria bacterium]|nr:MAG: hypothetical protein DRI24_18435 [Deltaproteobacteria bacterium]
MQEGSWYTKAGAQGVRGVGAAIKDGFQAINAVGRAAQEGSSTWARSKYTANYARGGFSSVVFAPNRKEMLSSMFRSQLRENSPEHIRAMEKLAMERNVSKGAVTKRMGNILEAKKGKLGAGLGKRVFGGVLGGAYIGYAALSANGGAVKKIRGGVSATAETVGFAAGGKAGLALGAAAGSFAGPLGSVVGGALGMIGGGLLGAAGFNMASEQMMDVLEGPAKREQRRRKVNWVHDNSAFMTQNAHTMRQTSLNAMNRGMTSARSMLGREGVMFHQ